MQWKNVTKTNWTVYDSTGRATDLLANYFPCMYPVLSVYDRFFLFARLNLPNVLISVAKKFFR